MNRESANGAENHGSHTLPPLPSFGFRAPTRAEVRRLRVLAVAGGVAWVLLMIVTLGLRPDRNGLSWPYAYGLPVFLGSVVFATLGLAVAGGKTGVGVRPLWVRVAVVGLPILFVLTNLWIEVGPNSVIPTQASQLWRANAMCGGMTAAFGLGPMLAAILALRHAFPVNAAWRGALVGACCGLAGSGAIHLHCAMASREHILLAHGAPIVLLAIVGAAIARRVLRV